MVNFFQLPAICCQNGFPNYQSVNTNNKIDFKAASVLSNRFSLNTSTLNRSNSLYPSILVEIFLIYCWVTIKVYTHDFRLNLNQRVDNETKTNAHVNPSVWRWSNLISLLHKLQSNWNIAEKISKFHYIFNRIFIINSKQGWKFAGNVVRLVKPK